MAEEDDFLASFGEILDDQQAENPGACNAANCTAQESSPDDDDEDGAVSKKNVKYNPQKPKWWKQVAGRTTKAQKRVIASMSDYQLPPIKWGEFYDWEEVFASTTTVTVDNNSNQPKDIWFEIGFGQGENLLALAHKYPQKRLIVGAEIHEPALGKAFQRVQEAIEKNLYWTDYVTYGSGTLNLEDSPEEKSSSNPYSNLRIYRGDGVKVLPRIPSNSLAAVLITFPDPFPKTGHEQWRVIQHHTLHDIHRILKPTGRLFLATDHEGFHQWSHTIVDQVNQEEMAKTSRKLYEILDTPPDRSEWLPAFSKYEQKGWDEGRKTWLSCWAVLK